MGDKSLQEAMTEATAGWYHALCDGLHLDATKFQLAQGNGIPFGTTSDYLWEAMDTIPPYSATNVWGASRSMFSSGYGDVLMSLQDPPDSQFQQALGENYDTWQQYLRAYTWLDGDTYDSVFRSWARRLYTPSEIDSLVDEMDQDTPVTAARAMWAKVGTSGTKAYVPSYDMLANTMRTAPAAKVSFSNTQSTKTFKDTWAQGNAEMYFDIFGGEGSTSYEQTSKKAFNGAISIDLAVAHALVVDVMPLYEVNNDPTLSKYKPWYDSAVLSSAFRNRSNQDEIWNPQGETSWDDAFGPKGFMRYITTDLVVVDGVTMTMTVKAEFDEHDRTTISGEYATGLWPFFFSEGSAGAKYRLDHVDKSGFSVTLTSMEGNYLILGANVEDAATALGS